MPKTHCAAPELASLLDGSSAGELIPELARHGLQQLIELELAAFLGADWHERTEERLGHRNGYRPRTLTTQVGDLALYEVIMEACIGGVSTRKVDALVGALGSQSGISKSQVSRICQEIDQQGQTAPISLAAMPPDIRWQQRFANFCQALDQLETFFQPPALNERERQGLIKAFEYCFELGWNTLRDLLLAKGNAGLIGSRDTLRLAFRVGLIGDGEAWLAMVQDRNLTSHTYNRSTAEQVSQQVEARYLPCFRELRQVLSERVQATAAEEGDG